MHTLILLLRGVMPTGKNRVPMASLREVMQAAGYQRVRTWIQSGNLLLDTAEDAEACAARVQALIREQLGPDLTVIARRPAEVADALSDNPFTEGCDPSRVFYGFFGQAPSAEALARIAARDFGDNRLQIRGLNAWLYIPGDYTKASLNGGKLERLAGVPLTTRNANTLRKLVEMAAEDVE